MDLAAKYTAILQSERRTPSLPLRSLGEKMCSWHADQPDSVVYAIGSHYVANKLPPQKEMVRIALHSLTQSLERQKYILESAMGVSTSLQETLQSNVAELQLIITNLKRRWMYDYRSGCRCKFLKKECRHVQENV